MMHSFCGTAEHYRRIRAVGTFCFGIGGPVTYKKSAVAEVLPAMRLDELLLETDSPYLPPVPYRGKRNESGYLPLICERIAGRSGGDDRPERPEDIRRRVLLTFSTPGAGR